MKNFEYFEGSLKNPTFRGEGGFTKYQYRRETVQEGGLGQLTDLRGLCKKEGGGGLIPQCTL